MTWPPPITLRSPLVSLEPLTHEHHDAIVDVVKDGELWRLWYTPIPEPDKVRAEIQRRLDLQAKGSMLPFVVIEPATARALGMTSYMNIDAVNKRAEIGSTWYRKSVQRTGINTQCKMLLLTHAFEDLHCIAVEFRTSFYNHQSRRAIERLGAKQDGILRSHALAPNGTLRDTVVFSIIAAEWPAVKAHLSWLMDKPRT